jgi:GT2 family glycosyltransferase
MSETISVIIPAYNAELTIARSVDSALNQTYPSSEIIIVDDGSTDNTEKIALYYGRRIHYMKHAVNRGPGAARNTGIRAAKSEWIAFLDADDFWLPGFLAACERFIRSHRECIAVSTGLRIIRSNGAIEYGPKSIYCNSNFEHYSKELDHFFDFWGEHDHIRTGSSVIWREALISVGLLNEGLTSTEDLELWGLLGTYGKWGFITEPLWVSNSESTGMRQGWFEKYRVRRANCPTVDKWQERILPRLKAADMPGFVKVRGRIAQIYAYTKLIGGDICGSRDITRSYGQDFPVNSVSRLLIWLAPKGLPLWRAASMALLLREMGKGLALTASAQCNSDRVSPPKGGDGA